jgi:hypothetical protein
MLAATSPRVRRAWTICATAAALAAAPLAAQEPADTAAAHVVRPGDTLWDLARRYLGDPFRWPDIFQLNRERVADPDLILPQWLLRIPGLAQPAGEVAAPPVPPAPAGQAPAGRTVFFEPEAAAAGPRLEFADEERAAPVTSGDFYGAGLLVPEAEVAPVGRLAELLNPSVVPLAIPPQIQPFDRVYLTLAPGAAVRGGDRLHLLRPGRRLERLGRIFHSTGIVRVLEVQGGTATVEVERMYDAIALGDLAVPLPDFRLPPPATAEEGAARLEGRLVAFQEPHPLHNLFDLAFVDLGGASGVREGDEFVAVLPPEPREWGLRPEIVVARLRVVRAAERTAAVRVIELEHPALETGLSVRRVAKVR